MTSRDSMLAAIRAARPSFVERPGVRAIVAQIAPPVDAALQFIESSEIAGARVVQGHRAELTELIAAAYPPIGRQVSALHVLETGSADELPYSFADTDVFVCEAVLGVAENGAVWLPLS